MQRRLRPWACLVAAVPVLLALLLLVLNLGTVRVSRQDGSFEWQNGWPLVFLTRHVTEYANDWRDWVATGVKSFSPGAAVVDCLALACILTAAWFVFGRRPQSQRPQFGVRGLLAAVLVVAALLGSGLHVQRRQLQAVERLEREDIHFRFMIDQGLPDCLRWWLPGDRLKPFDRVAWVSCDGPNYVDEQLAALEELGDVVVIHIQSKALRADAFHYLARLHSLRHLNVANITDEGANYLRGLRQLRTLNVSFSEMTDRGVACLSKLFELETLYFQFCRISDAGLAHLAELHQLRGLLLVNTDISDASVPVLVEFKKLRYLDVRGTRMTPNGAARLKQALPGCRVAGP